MHNLLLGTAKYIVSVWKEEYNFSKQDYQNMQDVRQNKSATISGSYSIQNRI